jgi:predicted dehydrogenase
MMEIGIVGAGAVATRHAQVLAGLDDVRVVGVADPDQGRARALAEPYGAEVLAHHRDLLDRHRLDALYICVPPFAHGPMELAAVEAGVPFLVEKPLAADLATAERIAARVAEAGLLTAVGYHWRYLDTVERVQALLADRPARLAALSWVDKVPPPPWWRHRELSGGQVVEQATHVLDLARLLVGEVEQVTAASSRRPWATDGDGDVPDVTAATLRFASGAIGSIAVTSLARRLHRAGIALVADGLVMELSEFDLVVDAGDGPVTMRADGTAKLRLDRDFLDVVAGRAERVRVDYAEALRTHRLGVAIRRAAGG